ncbi:MAG: hypothetical protein U0270_27545 [Labilithrix sp.]
MSAVPSPASKGVQPNAPVTFRAIIDSKKAEGGRMGLDDAIAVIVPVCLDLKERHAKGESFYVHPSAIAKTPDGLYRLNPQLAVNPKDPRDRATLAPEVLRSNGPGGARASVFAVGAMLYEAVCGTAVGPGMRRPRDVDPKLPESLEHLLAKALVADPSHRPDDLGALAAAMHHLAPMKSIPPPDADISKLDRSENFEVDIRLSIMPPERDSNMPPPPPSNPNLQIVMPSGGSAMDRSAAAQAAATQAMAAAAAKDPTRHLASLKARLESDPRPRYVVNKARMDHGPFAAVELLQQIASHKFVGTDILRDELTGGSKAIDEWEEFAAFAQHARLHRDIAQEKKEVAKVESAEKKAGAAKLVFGIIGAVAILAVGVFFVVKTVGSRKEGGDISDDPNAVDLSGGGSLKGNKKPGQGGGGHGGGGGGGGFPGGMSYEAALNSNNNEIKMGEKSGPDLTDGQLSGPLRNASFISACGAPDSMKVTVRCAIKNGRAVGVTVSTNPPNAGVASCVDHHVRSLSWPSSSKMDSFTTTY